MIDWLDVVSLTLILVSLFIAVVIVYGPFVYSFEMTLEQINETKILPYCYIQNDMLITALNSTCFQMYGGPVN